MLVASENRLLREVMAKLLLKKTGFLTVRVAAGFEDLVRQVSEAHTQVLLLDPGDASTSFLGLVQETVHAVPGLKVIVVGMEPELETFIRYVKAGITGYVLRDVSAGELAQAVLSVASGFAICPKELCFGLFQYVAGEGRQTKDFKVQPRWRLSTREQQLLKHVRLGSTNKEIAVELKLSEQTVKNHMHRIFRKLGARDRLAAAEIWSE